jgi:hypothetical protein
LAEYVNGIDMEIYEIIKTREYSEAKKKIGEWKKRLKKTDREEAFKIRDEQREFFSKMKETFPEMHELFAVSRKEIVEMIFQRITGQEIIID